MSAITERRDTVLEPALRARTANLNAAERVQLAQVLARWADQLAESAMLIDPDLVPMIPPPKVPRGFFLVNLSRRNQDNLRKLARANGVEFRTVMRWAITRTRMELEEKIRLAKLMGVAPRACWSLTEGCKEN